jgi:hypothetical protein
MFILAKISFCTIGFAIKYIFISYFSHINFFSGWFSQIYLLIVSLIIFSLTMVNFAINIFNHFNFSYNYYIHLYFSHN